MCEKMRVRVIIDLGITKEDLTKYGGRCERNE